MKLWGILFLLGVVLMQTAKAADDANAQISDYVAFLKEDIHRRSEYPRLLEKTPDSLINEMMRQDMNYMYDTLQVRFSEMIDWLCVNKSPVLTDSVVSYLSVYGGSADEFFNVSFIDLNRCIPNMIQNRVQKLNENDRRTVLELFVLADSECSQDTSILACIPHNLRDYYPVQP